MDFEGSHKIVLCHEYFDLQIFDNEPTVPLIFFENCKKTHFVSSFFHMKEI